jgi:hypothetical protein
LEKQLSNELYKYKVVTGDWSADGHGRTESYMISCNLDSKEISTCINAGLKAIDAPRGQSRGAELPFCQKYGDNVLSYSVILKLKAQGFCEDWLVAEGADETDEEYLYGDDFFNIWCEILKLGARISFPDHQLVIEEEEPELCLNIGGYGLFDS